MKSARFALLTLTLLTLAIVGPPSTAKAHDPDNPEAHRSMPNQVTAGAITLCPTAHDLDRPGSRQGAEGVACIGAALSFSRELGRHFELRIRAAYDKPFLFDDTELDSLHEVRATLSADAVFYRLRDKLTLTLGPELGLATFVHEQPDENQTYWGVAWGGVLGIRPWLTYHTGLFAEAGFGGTITWQDDTTLSSTTLGRITLGWADRF